MMNGRSADAARALQLMRDGLTVREISQVLGCSVGRTHALLSEQTVKPDPAALAELLRDYRRRRAVLVLAGTTSTNGA